MTRPTGGCSVDGVREYEISLNIALGQPGKALTAARTVRPALLPTDERRAR